MRLTAPCCFGFADNLAGRPERCWPPEADSDELSGQDKEAESTSSSTEILIDLTSSVIEDVALLQPCLQ